MLTDALALARGPLLADRAPGRYGWLTHELIEAQLPLLVADVALALAAHHLEAGAPPRRSRPSTPRSSPPRPTSASGTSCCAPSTPPATPTCCAGPPTPWWPATPPWRRRPRPPAPHGGPARRTAPVLARHPGAPRGGELRPGRGPGRGPGRLSGRQATVGTSDRVRSGEGVRPRQER
ncbi:hypothetical protein NKH77_23215 [Streptomyces sp. M19]